MTNRNLWETKLGENYTFLNNIGEVIQAIKDGKLNLNFQIKDRFTPGNNVDNYLEQVANDKNVMRLVEFIRTSKRGIYLGKSGSDSEE